MNEEKINKIEILRTRNNINWMNILRLANKHAPKELDKILDNINQIDNEISEILRDRNFYKWESWESQ